MLTSMGNGVRSATRMSPLFLTTRIPYRGKVPTVKAAVIQKTIYCRGAFGEGNIVHGDLRNDGKRYNERRHLGIDGSVSPLGRQSLRIIQDLDTNCLRSSTYGVIRPVSGGHSVRMLTTNSDSSASNDKDAKLRLTALRLYRILQRLCGSLSPTSEGTIFLQHDISASDWGHYQFHDNGCGGDFMTEDQTEKLIRLFLVLSGTDPVSGISKRNDWYNDLMGLIPNKVDKNTNTTRTCWTTPSRLREAVRFAFRSSSSLSSLSPSELQALALRAIQMMPDQVKLWNQSSVTNSQNGLVRVTATSRCLGTVSPVSIGASYSPLTPKYRFAYRIRVENISSSETVQLLGRYWQIAEEYDDDCDADGSSPEPIEVDAPYTGAVGQLPVLQPGQVFEYVSGTDLTTPRGKMMGHLYMATVLAQTQSAKSGDEVTAVTCHGSKGSSSSSSSKDTATDDDNSNQTRLFHAIVKPFRLESFEN
jgi:uncharacterized protein affecting Mg2+/Co2+ transport